MILQESGGETKPHHFSPFLGGVNIRQQVVYNRKCVTSVGENHCAMCLLRVCERVDSPDAHHKFRFLGATVANRKKMDGSFRLHMPGLVI
mmetsp:Transcript_44059/g.74254  ORF Transcript_44059/g.74254 Transcript_44059/m.74254 type:complete len:90 (-) Transcript_44059:129-398(-)